MSVVIWRTQGITVMFTCIKDDSLVCVKVRVESENTVEVRFQLSEVRPKRRVQDIGNTGVSLEFIR